MANAVIIVSLAFIFCANGITIGPFENVTSGVWDEWNAKNPENVKGNFAVHYGSGNLWFVSRRKVPNANASDPRESAAVGGIVSTLRVSTKTWTHKTYDRLVQDVYQDQLISLNGRLFMLLYSTDQSKVVYHKLFFWKDEEGKWMEIPMEIDPMSMTEATHSMNLLSASVPKQDGKVAYLVASAHAAELPGCETAYAKLQPEFNGILPVKAKLMGFVGHLHCPPSAVFFTAVLDDTLYAFFQYMASDGFHPEPRQARRINLKTNILGLVNLTGQFPQMGFADDRMFQTKSNEMFIVGGYKMVGRAGIEFVYDIWSLNLKSLQWQFTNATMPRGGGPFPTFDQQGGKLYMVGAKEGVSVAQVS